jgi:hypothetical protein
VRLRDHVYLCYQKWSEANDKKNAKIPAALKTPERKGLVPETKGLVCDETEEDERVRGIRQEYLPVGKQKGICDMHVVAQLVGYCSPLIA